MGWNGRRAGIAIAVVLIQAAAVPCSAGESFLDRDLKVHEAVPYGRSAYETAARTPTPRAGEEPEHAGPEGTPGVPAERP